jgi:excisionase family DNA binding protein
MAASEGRRSPLTLAEAAEYLSISKQSVRRLVIHRTIPAIRIGRLLRVDPAALDEFICRKTVPAESDSAMQSEGKR